MLKSPAMQGFFLPGGAALTGPTIDPLAPLGRGLG